MNAPRITRSALPPIGIELRTARVRRSLRLRDVAAALECTPAFVSALEVGKKPLPDGFIEDFSRILSLSEEETQSLRKANDLSRNHFVLKPDSPEAKLLAAALEKKINKLSAAQIQEILRSYFAWSSRDPAVRYRHDKWVRPRDRKEIYALANVLRDGFGYRADRAIPMIELLDIQLLKLFPNEVVFQVVEDSELPRGVDGLTDSCPSQMIIPERIYLAACDYDDEYARWVLAHELGHFWLRHEKNYFSRAAPNIGKPTRTPIQYSAEFQADEFAAQLLMPAEHCFDGDSKKIAWRYRVSENIARNRIKNLHRRRRT